MTGTTTQDRPERRGHERGRVPGKAVIRTGGRALQCDVDNLSCAGGLFLLAAECRVSLDIGAAVSVQIDALGPDLLLHGQVIRSDDSGTQIAIAFQEVADALTDTLRSMVSGAISAADCPRVMVVDPLPAERSRVAAALRRAGCDPVEASTPLEAIDAIQRPENRVAGAAIRDSLTQTDGGELARYLADEHPSMPVAILSDSDDATAAIDDDRAVPVLPIDGDISGPVRAMLQPAARQAGPAVTRPSSPGPARSKAAEALASKLHK
jgi:CheY-like chemotaxis protein